MHPTLLRFAAPLPRLLQWGVEAVEFFFACALLGGRGNFGGLPLVVVHRREPPPQLPALDAAHGRSPGLWRPPGLYAVEVEREGRAAHYSRPARDVCGASARRLLPASAPIDLCDLRRVHKPSLPTLELRSVRTSPDGKTPTKRRALLPTIHELRPLRPARIFAQPAAGAQPAESGGQGSGAADVAAFQVGRGKPAPSYLASDRLRPGRPARRSSAQGSPPSSRRLERSSDKARRRGSCALRRSSERSSRHGPAAGREQ